ncbi:MAG TPA: hypothetical protein RMH85_05545 [Polyangiaceae bacterium LLY-WYZ-15_(1-7)]|nr:hypothetical protein [Myxococcales bacterium]MAT27589.1 hypothetical protein [Sandaracinus sp.]HJK92816.1 hypothetical protein [Polyangiaceae bacterium LLY-WYZ-15_(1-7)]HJL05320.1 hypothetical protein [Polyangiaceae bacterium LLY-WYZ-15_(1-7)]HJL07938.1 hypothetical protein [Polyangiaceae bacterium LLY-WYZ-15_(1-7)]
MTTTTTTPRLALRAAAPGLLAGALLALLAAPTPLAAQDASPTECAPTEEVDRYRLLRSLSLDLLGRIPTVAEYQLLDTVEEIDEPTLRALLASEEHFAQVRQYHRALLWGSLDGVNSLAAGQRRLRLRRGPNIWRNPNARATYRGRNDVDCLDQPQTEWDERGVPVPIRTFAGMNCRGGSCRQEGYVMVAPYWAPDTRIKVCAYDAQANAMGTDGQPCDVYNPNLACGCGPNLRQCSPGPNTAADRAMREALTEEPARLFEHIVRQGRSYFDAFTTNETLVNGASVHYYRHMSGVDVLSRGAVTYDPAMGELPDLDFRDQEDWRVVEREEAHAGVLTTYGFLMRFGSNRGRANRFYTAFRCEPFMPPAEGLPEEVEEDPSPNLRERTGCAGCHQTLEVAAAAWGRWRASTTFGLLRPVEVDMMGARAECAACDTAGGTRCSAFCNSYFITADNGHPEELATWRGFPQARAWLEESEATIIEAGPEALVDEPMERQKVASCTVRNLAEHYLGRELSETELLEWVPALRREFEASDYDFTELTYAIVSSEPYRTVR